MVGLMLAHDRSEMGRLAEWLDVQEHDLALPRKVAFAVRQCLEEAVANLLDHTPRQPGEHILVELSLRGATCVAVVEDDGPPFDLRGAPTPERPSDLETLIPGGWGIHLIRAFATAINYHTEAGRNRLTLTFAPPVLEAARPPEGF